MFELKYLSRVALSDLTDNLLFLLILLSFYPLAYILSKDS
jgi:hypothetical protein